MVSLILTLFALSGPVIEIPGGSILMEDAGSSTPPREVALKPFRINPYEVTNEEFAKRFRSHRYRSGAERRPVTRVTYDEAVRFCRAEGGHLPTSAGWEMAARGPEDRIFPWGDKAPRKNPQTCYSGVVKRRGGSDRTDVSYYGVRDMAGSVWEWTDDDVDGKKAARGGMWNLLTWTTNTAGSPIGFWWSGSTGARYSIDPAGLPSFSALLQSVP
jgi:formylglycine-generating enzyme required for sulfatase activity